jgi:outer membrane biosynthesis protein TonB
VTVTGVVIMASNIRAFFAGIGTTFVILGIGFGGGVLLANNVMEPTTSVAARSTLPAPDRIILPASAEAAQPPQPSTVVADPPPPATPIKAMQQPIEQSEPAKPAEQQKAESRQHDRRKKLAERKAKREATRLAIQQREQRHQRLGIMASRGDNDQQGFGGGFFGN